MSGPHEWLEIELVGGPHDGVEMALSKPLDTLVMPVPFSPDLATVGYGAVSEYWLEASVPRTVTYHRCVISDVTHRWRYVFGSHTDVCRTWPVDVLS